jgi:hypothetical protein
MRGTILAATAAAALAFAPHADARGWGKPKTIAEPIDAGSLDPPTVVAGPRGQVAAAWTQGEGIGVAFARNGRRFGPAAVVPHSKDEYYPVLGIDAAGNTTIAWVYEFECSYDGISTDVCEGIRGAARLRDGSFTARRTLTSERYDSDWPRVSVSPAGRAAVWWQGLDYESGSTDANDGARVARRPGRFGPVEMHGRDIATWTFDRRGASAQVVFRTLHSLVGFTRKPGGKLTRRRVLLKVATPNFYPGIVDADSRGIVSAAWENVREGRSSHPNVSSLVVALRTLHGRLGPHRIARDLGPTGLTPLDVASGPTGLTVAAWGTHGTRPQAFDDSTYDYFHEAELRAAVRLPGRRFARSQRLEPRYPERPVYGLDAAAGPRSAVVMWRATRANGAQGIYAAQAGPTGRFGRPRLLSADSTEALSDPAVVVDRHDNATVVWIDGLRVRAARFASG